MKKNLLQDCIKKREEIISQGLKNTSSSHDVPSPLLLSGTKVDFYFYFGGYFILKIVIEYFEKIDSHRTR